MQPLQHHQPDAIVQAYQILECSCCFIPDSADYSRHADINISLTLITLHVRTYHSIYTARYFKIFRTANFNNSLEIITGSVFSAMLLLSKLSELCANLTSITLETAVPSTVLSTTVFLEWCIPTQQHIPMIHHRNKQHNTN